MNLFEDLPTIENTEESFIGDRSKQMDQEYVCWHIGNSSLLCIVFFSWGRVLRWKIEEQ